MHRTADPFPSTTIGFYLWKRPDPRVFCIASLAVYFSLDGEAAILTENGQNDPFPSTTLSFYIWRRPDPRAQIQGIQIAFFLVMTERPIFPKTGGSIRFRQQPDPFPSTTPPFSVNNYRFLPLVAPGP